jgi:hypothetical protein
MFTPKIGRGSGMNSTNMSSDFMFKSKQRPPYQTVVSREVIPEHLTGSIDPRKKEGIIQKI